MSRIRFEMNVDVTVGVILSSHACLSDDDFEIKSKLNPSPGFQDANL